MAHTHFPFMMKSAFCVSLGAYENGDQVKTDPRYTSFINIVITWGNIPHQEHVGPKVNCTQATPGVGVSEGVGVDTGAGIGPAAIHRYCQSR